MKRKLLWGLLTLCLALLLAPISMKEVSAATDRAVVMSVSPAEGPIEGGNTVILTGTNFEDVVRVKFGNTEATHYQVDSSTQITATVPAKAAGQIIVSVDNNYENGVTGNYYTYIDYAATNTTKSISYATIEDAITAAASGDTIQILKDITLTAELSLSVDMTLDLNGHTITGKSVTVTGATVTIKDTATGGKITNQNASIILMNAGNLNLISGTVERAGGGANYAIENNSTGTINISGGIVQSIGDTSLAIKNYSSGKINISGGIVQSTGNASYAIWTVSSSTVNISGGTVQSTGNPSWTIFKGGSSTVNISGGLVQNNSGNYAVYNGTADGSGVSIDASATIIGKLNPVTTDPTATTILATKTVASQASVDFTLTNIPSYSNGIGWIVYDAATGGNQISDVTASNVGNILTLASISAGLPAADYYIAAYDRASGYGESARLKLTVEDTVTVPDAPIFGTPTVNNQWVYLSWTEPVNNGGSPITHYKMWHGSNNNIEDATESPTNITGTTAKFLGYYGQTYYFWVKAVNAVGSSVASVSVSATVTDPNIALVGAAKAAIEGGTYTMTQATANTSTAVKAELATQINALSGMSSTGITVTAANITLSAFTAANTGTSGTPAGTNGSFSFTVALTKGVVTDTTTATSGTITATAYIGVTDVQAVAAAKTAVVGDTVTVAYGSDQTVKTAAVQTYVDGIISSTANAAGVTAAVTYNSGNIYNVAISKGIVNDSKAISMTVNESANPDIARVGAAKAAIEGGTYTMTQATANTSTTVKTELATQINALSGMSSTGITVVASDITLSAFTAANTGTSGIPAGTNGSFSFTVALMKGVVTDTTTAQTGTITATAYTGNSGNNGNNNGGGNTNATTTPKSEGIIQKTQQSEKDAPQVSINNSIDNLKASVFTANEQAKVAAGENAKVTLKIEDLSASVRVEDKKLIEDELRKVLQNTDTKGSEQQSTLPTMLYVDISLYKQIGSGEATKVTETNTKISISIEVPQELWNTDSNNNRIYRIVRVHNGAVEILDGTYDPKTHLFTFETDRFSTYALTYQDTKAVTADTTTDTSTDPAKDELMAYNDFFHLQLTAKVTHTSQTVSYAKMSEADGYLIYGAKYGKTLKKRADVSGTVLSYTDKKLNKATCYKYQVKAYRIIDGKKVIIATSKVIYSYTTGEIYANPTKVTTEETSVKLTVGNTYKLTCQVEMPKGSKLKEHTKLLCYESSDKTVATVGSTGKVTAKAKGTCYVYAYAQNGRYVKVKITVE